MEIDLFEHYETLPQEVKDILDEFWEQTPSYEGCANLVTELEAVGYTCDYGLDADPHSLTKL